jgi:hypothetical protein
MAYGSGGSSERPREDDLTFTFSRRTLRRTALAVIVRVIGAAAFAVSGLTCSSPSRISPAQAGRTMPTAPTTIPSTTLALPTTTAATTTTGAPTTTARAAPSTTAALPRLGQPWASNQEGYGQARPRTINNGGDPTGIVTNIVWSSWGGSRALGTGTSDYAGPNQTVAQGTEESATVVAFNLGTCNGKLMYQGVEWYFPQHGQKFRSEQLLEYLFGYARRDRIAQSS